MSYEDKKAAFTEGFYKVLENFYAIYEANQPNITWVDEQLKPKINPSLLEKLPPEKKEEIQSLVEEVFSPNT